MDKPRVGHLQADFIEMHWVVPPIGPMSSLSEDEANDLLRKTMVPAQWFAIIFNATMVDPTYLPLVTQIMKTAAEMLQAEMEERDDAEAEEIRKMLEGD